MTAALAFFVVSATLVAVTVWVPGCDGAVYKPEPLIVPTEGFPPAVESTDQVTAVFVVFWTVAVNCFVVPTAMVTDDKFRATLTTAGGGEVFVA